jgi:hypothetical protein
MYKCTVINKLCTGKNVDGRGRGQFEAAYSTAIYLEYCV